MAGHTKDTPSWVGAILDAPETWTVARAALALAYAAGGVAKLLDFPGAIAEQAHFGLSPPWAWAVLTIVVELAGSVLLIWGRWLWLGAGALGVFTLLAAIVANPFWALDGQARFMARNAFEEHIGLIGGLALAAMVGRLKSRETES